MQDEPDEFEMSDDIPWPERGDRVFKSDHDWWHNAYLNYMPDDWELYIMGYKSAADVLVQYVKETRSEQDVLVFPTVFLYRHYIELRLKEMIQNGKRLLDEAGDFPKHHALEKLWAQCRANLERIDPRIPERDFEAIDGAINQFCSLDPGSFTFRYPLSKSGQRSLPPELHHLNLRNLAEVMEKIANFLDSASAMISEYLQHKGDMARYFQDYYGP